MTRYHICSDVKLHQTDSEFMQLLYLILLLPIHIIINPYEFHIITVKEIRDLVVY